MASEAVDPGSDPGTRTVSLQGQTLHDDRPVNAGSLFASDRLLALAGPIGGCVQLQLARDSADSARST